MCLTVPPLASVTGLQWQRGARSFGVGASAVRLVILFWEFYGYWGRTCFSRIPMWTRRWYSYGVGPFLTESPLLVVLFRDTKRRTVAACFSGPFPERNSRLQGPARSQLRWHLASTLCSRRGASQLSEKSGAMAAMGRQASVFFAKPGG